MNLFFKGDMKLSKNSKKVLKSILRDPSQKQKEIAQNNSIHPSTVSHIVNRLKEKDVLKKIYIPNFFTLEKAEICYTSRRFLTTLPDKMRKELIEFSLRPAHPVFLYHSRLQWNSIAVSLTEKNHEEGKSISTAEGEKESTLMKKSKKRRVALEKVGQDEAKDTVG